MPDARSVKLSSSGVVPGNGGQSNAQPLFPPPLLDGSSPGSVSTRLAFEDTTRSPEVAPVSGLPEGGVAVTM